MSKLVNEKQVEFMKFVCSNYRDGEKRVLEIQKHTDTLSSYDRFIHNPVKPFDTLVSTEQVSLIYDDLENAGLYELRDTLISSQYALENLQHNLEFQVFVKFNTTFSMMITCHTLVWDMKVEMHQQHGFREPQHLRFLFGGRQINDHMTAQQCGFSPDCTIFLSYRVHGD